MEKSILDIVNTFSLWKGNSYTLANLIVERQKELDKEALVARGYTEAAEAL
jgi:hypothetical protein